MDSKFNLQGKTNITFCLLSLAKLEQTWSVQSELALLFMLASPH